MRCSSLSWGFDGSVAAAIVADVREPRHLRNRVAPTSKLEVRILAGANHNTLLAQTGGDKEMSGLDSSSRGISTWSRAGHARS